MVLNQEQFDAFRMEIATFGNIPILSQYCGIGCVFCKVHTDSYLGHYPKIPMIDKEDLIKGFAFINPNVNYVRLGAGVLVAPHTDPFLHPQIYDYSSSEAPLPAGSLHVPPDFAAAAVPAVFSFVLLHPPP